MELSSRKGAINQQCRQCVVDPCSSGAWRQQITLCNVDSCALWLFRPKASSVIPETVLSWYGVKSDLFEPPICKSEPEAR